MNTDIRRVRQRTTVATISIASIATGMLMCAAAMAGDNGIQDNGSDETHGNRGGRHGSVGGGMFPMADPERMLEHMSRRLQLDETQQQEISNIMSAARPQLESLRDRDAANRKSLQQLDSADPDYSAKVQNIAIDNGQIATELTLALAQLRVDIDSKLTPEQRANLRESTQQFRESGRRGERRRKDDQSRDAAD